MVFSVTRRIAKSVGFDVPTSVSTFCDVTALLAAVAALFFGPDFARYFGPFDWPTTFQASVVDGRFVVDKTRTDAEGRAEIWYCQMIDHRLMMSPAFEGLFSERPERLSLDVLGVAPMDRDRPLVILTNINIDDEQISFFQVVDPQHGATIARHPQVEGRQGCDWDSVKEYL